MEEQQDHEERQKHRVPKIALNILLYCKRCSTYVDSKNQCQSQNHSIDSGTERTSIETPQVQTPDTTVWDNE